MSGWWREIGKLIQPSRSRHWFKTRQNKVKLNPKCEVCGKSHSLQVHHKLPFHLYPHLELEMGNLITLCDRCHLLMGHLGWWKAYNPTIEEDAKIWREKIKNRPTT